MTDCLTYAGIKVFVDGTMVIFTTVNDCYIASEPQGQVRMLPYSTSGFTFQRLSDNIDILTVKNWDYIYDQAGVSYGATIEDVYNAVNDLLGFPAGGGGGGGDASAANQVIIIDELVDINTELDTQTGLLGRILDKSSISPSNVVITTDLTFKPLNREIEFNDIPIGFKSCDLLVILNYTQSQVIFDPFVSGKSGNFLGSVLKLDYDTTSMQETDIICAYLVDNTQIILLNKIFETLDTLTKETKRQNAITNHILTS